MNTSIATIREMKEQLISRAIKPSKDEFYTGYAIPELRDGVVYIGLCAMHPSAFIDMFGVRKFRKLPRDISKKKIEKFIKWHKKNWNKIKKRKRS